MAEQWPTGGVTPAEVTTNSTARRNRGWRRPEMYRAVVELEAPSAALDDLTAVRRLVDDIVDAFGFNLLRYEAVEFEPIGVTGFGVIGESHVSVHTWPEDRYAHVELLTCVELPPAEELQCRFPLSEENIVEVRRCEP